jgi:hypothetical protein
VSAEASPEECFGCANPSTVTVASDADLALCQAHWNAWVARYLGADDVPCNAHLIGYGKDEDA